jgi:hypothetical protein
MKLGVGRFNFQLFFLFHLHFYLSPRFKIWHSTVVCGSGRDTWIYICMPAGASQLYTRIYSTLKESAPPLQAFSSVFFCFTYIDENPIRFTVDFLPIFLIFSIPFLWLFCLLYWHPLNEPVYNNCTKKLT